MRTFKVLSTVGPLRNEYITQDEEYYLVSLSSLTDHAIYKRIKGHAGSFMNISKFKAALKCGDIIFTD